MKKPLSILFTGSVGESLPPPYGGIPKRALMLAALWKQQGHRLGITFTYRHQHEDDLEAKAEYFFEFNQLPNKFHKIWFVLKHIARRPILFADLCISWNRLEKRFTRQSIYYAAYGIFLERIYLRFKPDVIVGEAALIRSYMAARIARIHGIPFVLEPYAEIHDRSMAKLPGFTEEQRTAYWHTFLALVDRIIGSSRYCSQGALQYAAPNKVKVVYATTLNVQRYSQVIDIQAQRALRQSFGLNPDLFYTISVGAFTHRKGHDHLIKAIAKLKSTHSNLGIILCGAGTPDTWKELARTTGVADRVFFFQGISESDLINLYKCADAYCDVSNTPRACLGIALTEGMASHLPAIAYNAGGLPEVVIDKETGVLVPLDNIDELAQAVAYLSELSLEERQTLGHNAFTRMQQLFDIRVIADQLLEEYSSVIR